MLSHLQDKPLMGITLKNCYAYRLTIIAQTFCDLKEIALTAIEVITRKKLLIVGLKYSNRTVTAGKQGA